MAALDRPDAPVQPVHQCHVIGISPEQGHGGMSVQVHQARQQDMLGQAELPSRGKARSGFIGRHQRDDTA